MVFMAAILIFCRNDEAKNDEDGKDEGGFESESALGLQGMRFAVLLLGRQHREFATQFAACVGLHCWRLAKADNHWTACTARAAALNDRNRWVLGRWV
jgi:hypothetical protein